MRQGWVCLLYHDVSDGPVHESVGRRHFSVPAHAFEQQLDWLRERGYQGCSIERALQWPGEKRIAISFDDGEAGQYERAVPALLERGMTATFLIPTSWVGRPGFVTWKQLREMKAAGMSIQSHTHSHPFLSELERNALIDELRTAKAELDRWLSQTTNQLAFPGGDPPRRSLLHLLKETGYEVAATSEWGRNQDGPAPRGGVKYIRRCTIRGAPMRETFERILAGDRWMTYRRWARDSVLRTVRTSLGPHRYARWRRRVLGALARDHSVPSGPRETADGAGQ